jgi:hypothetical protein
MRSNMSQTRGVRGLLSRRLALDYVLAWALACASASASASANACTCTLYLLLPELSSSCRSAVDAG